MIRPFLKVMQALRHHLPISSEKPESAVGDKSPQPTAASPANSPTTGNSDPHMLANLYLDKHGREKGHLTLRFYHGQPWRWKNLRYQVIGKDELRAEVTRAVKRDFDEQAGKGPTNRRPMHVTCSLITNVLQAVSSKWCDTNGNKAITAQSFGKEVKRHFPDISRERETSGERRWLYHGLRLRNHDGDADGPATGGPPGSPSSRRPGVPMLCSELIF